MRVIIPDLTEDQAKAVIKAIAYHFSNEGVCCDSDVVPTMNYLERSPPAIPDRIKIQMDNMDEWVPSKFNREQTAILMESAPWRSDFKTEEDYQSYLENEKERLKEAGILFNI